MPSLGELRIDLIADIARFVSPFATATNRLERFAKDVAKSLDGIEKGLQKAGTSLTLRITAPLAALSIASVKAADTNGRFADSLERLGLQAQAALAPLGKNLIQAFDSIRPAIEDGIRLVKGFGQAFDELDDPTKMAVIRMGAVAAAIGPALVLSAGFFAVLKQGVTVIAFTAANLGNLAKALVGVEVVAAGISIGGALEKNFPETIQGLIAGFRVFVTGVVSGFKIIGATVLNISSIISGAFLKAIAVASDGMAKLLQLVQDNSGFFSGVLDGATLGLLKTDDLGAGGIAERFRQGAAELNTLSAEYFSDYAGKIADISDTTSNSITDISDEFRATIANIRGGVFDDTSTGYRAFVDQLLLDLQAPLSAITDAFGVNLPKVFPELDELNALLSRAREIAAGVKLPEVVTKADEERIKRFNAELEKMEQAAERIRQRNDPSRAIRQELAEATRLNAAGVLSDEDFLAAAARIQKALADIGDKAEETFGDKIAGGIERFSTRVSDSFADLVVDGKAAFDELGKAFLKMLVQITAQEAIFGPLAKSLGANFSEIFKGGPSSIGVPGANATVNPGPNPSILSASGSFKVDPIASFVRSVTPKPSLYQQRNAGDGMPVARTTVNLIDQRKSGASVEMTESTAPDGSKIVTAKIRDEMKAAFADGSMDRIMAQLYGASRRGARR